MRTKRRRIGQSVLARMSLDFAEVVNAPNWFLLRGWVAEAVVCEVGFRAGGVQAVVVWLLSFVGGNFSTVFRTAFAVDFIVALVYVFIASLAAVFMPTPPVFSVARSRQVCI
jgi:hypothetical protein